MNRARLGLREDWASLSFTRYKGGKAGFPSPERLEFFALEIEVREPPPAPSGGEEKECDTF